ncbi:MAG: DnaJ domain-containing protein [Chloroflexi bacterium]|nr:DnaJ domain-containing protein [Chloroflexota bacterium]
MPPRSEHADETTRLPVLAEQPALPAPRPDAPAIKADPGLYAVLGLDPSVSDWEIQTTYRRMASRLTGNSSRDNQSLKQLNVAYEVLGNPARRTEYDRQRLHQALVAGTPTPIRPGAKSASRTTRRRRPRSIVQPSYAGLGDVMVVLTVVGLAVVAGFLLIPRLSINLSALNALQVVLPLTSAAPRRVIDVTVTAVPTAAPTATPLPSVAARYAGSTVSVSNPTPAPNTPESVQIHLRRDGQPLANYDVWSSVEYRTTQERWPATGTVKTDPSGAATITFNIGSATPDYPVTVHVYTQADDQQLSWSTTFTPQ